MDDCDLERERGSERGKREGCLLGERKLENGGKEGAC